LCSMHASQLNREPELEKRYRQSKYGLA